MPEVTIDSILADHPEARKIGDEWRMRCPAHDDHVPSLSVREIADGRLLVHCFAGCPQGKVMAALGMGGGGTKGRNPAPKPDRGTRPSRARNWLWKTQAEAEKAFEALRPVTDDAAAKGFFRSEYALDPERIPITWRVFSHRAFGRGVVYRGRTSDGGFAYVFRGFDRDKDRKRTARFLHGHEGSFFLNAGPGAALVIVGGEEKALVAWQSGFSAICPFGGEKTPSEVTIRMVLKFDPPLIVLGNDNDLTGRNANLATAGALEVAGFPAERIRVVAWPDDAPEGFDLNDVAKTGAEAVRQILNQAPVYVAGIHESEGFPMKRDMHGGEPTGRAPKRRPMSNIAIAREIARRRPTLVRVSGDLWEFTGAIYEKVPEGSIEADCIGILGDRAGTFLLRDIRNLLGVEVQKADAFFDQIDRSRYIVLENGVLDLNEMRLLPHSPDFRARNRLSVKFDPSATCPRFNQALLEWLPDEQARGLLIEWYGYCLIPDISQEKILFLVGDGGNGKGRAIRVLESLLGKQNVSGVPLSALQADRTFPTAALDGKLLNICPESELSRRELDIGWIKSLVSADTIQVERKGRDPFAMRPRARFVIQSNNPPNIADRTDGFWRRLMVVRFTRKFTEREQDKDLDSKLERELCGILNMALQGLQRLRSRGHFEQSAEMEAERSAYRRDSNPLEEWKEERLVEVGRPVRLSGGLAYRDYENWCDNNGHRPDRRNEFTREMKRLGVKTISFKDERSMTVRGFEGVALVTQVTRPTDSLPD